MEIVQVITQLLLYCWAFTLSPIFYYKQPAINILEEDALHSIWFLSGLGQKCYLSRMAGVEGLDIKEDGMGALGCCPHSPVPHLARTAAGKRLWRWRPPGWGPRQCHSKPLYRMRGDRDWLFCPGGDTRVKTHNSSPHPHDFHKHPEVPMS